MIITDLGDIIVSNRKKLMKVVLFFTYRVQLKVQESLLRECYMD